MNLPSAFSYRQGILHCQDVDLRHLADEVSTPCYLYSESAIVSNLDRLRQSFSAVEPLICYAVKANSNLSVLKLLLDNGSGFDIVSGGELRRVLHVGADPRQVVFSGVGKSRQELEMALQTGLFSIHVESLPELELIGRLARQRGQRARISFRFNPDVDARTHPYIATGLRRHKFGLDISRAGEVIEALKGHPGLEVAGVGCHIGSQIFDMQPFIESFRKVKQVAGRFREQGFKVRHLDLGGGLGVPYEPGQSRPQLARYAEVVEREREDYQIVLEPGRCLVADAGALLTRVLYRKVNNDKHFVVVDGAMNDLLRPSLYQAYHEIAPVEQKEAAVCADVVGPVCETGDFLARDRLVADFRSGDLAAVLHAGAYGFCLSSNYNSRPRTAEVMVRNGGWDVIRCRESFQDLIRGEEPQE
ncbi:MAG TPA: diaminopimelate decarboxylase [Acidobacteriota bacterium]|nr:diaminopimelate decarboxylase [Acidobacteriota bacterium]